MHNKSKLAAAKDARQGAATDRLVRDTVQHFRAASFGIRVASGRFDGDSPLRIESPGRLPCFVGRPLSRP